MFEKHYYNKLEANMQQEAYKKRTSIIHNVFSDNNALYYYSERRNVL